METIELKVQVREGIGKKAAKAIRIEGNIPAILYGRGVEPTPLVVNVKELHRATHTKAGENALISLKMEGKAKKTTTCLIKEIQIDPVTDQVYHVDFAAISLTEKIKVNVPVHLKGTDQAVGMKEGGVLDWVHHEIEVECLPTEIPAGIDIDVKAMNIGDAIHLKDISLPPGVTPLLEVEEVLVALHPPQKIEEETPAAEAATEPEVIEKGKKEKPEEGAAPEAGAEAKKPEKSEKAAEKPSKKEAA